MNKWKKIKKYFEYFYTKIKLLFKQKAYKQNDIVLKYLFDRYKDSKDLVVIFSACTREGIKARYNYVRTLKSVHCNKLFILDDFAADKRGCYYVGRYPDYKVEKAVNHLINMICGKVHAEKLIFCGSSKGGWASLNFGFQAEFPNKTIICGAPQYYLGDYLKNFKETFTFIKGNHNDADVIAELNAHLKKSILLGHRPKMIYLHYSIKDHTYYEHIHDLVDELHNSNLELTEDIKTYENHFDVSLYFPEFLLDSIRCVIAA